VGIVGIVGRVDGSVLASVGDGNVPSTERRLSILDICNAFHV
jgi:hypothetical protein